MNKDSIIDVACASPEFLDALYQTYLSNSQELDPSWDSLFTDLQSQSPASSTDILHAYRCHGHLWAQTNPLSMVPLEQPPQLQIPCEDQALIDSLQKSYCGSIGFEYMNKRGVDFEGWLQNRIEQTFFKLQISIEQKKQILQDLNKSELFEIFLHTKYVGQKRFSLEGAETLIPMLSAFIEKGAELGGVEYVVGMSHRGRLNVLANILDKSYGEIFHEFDPHYIPDSCEGSGDVKYHKGFESEKWSSIGKKMQVQLMSNPSHLESVDGVVEGFVKARQCKTSTKAIIPILIHGDAALSGQGIVYETLQLRDLEGYSTGGTVHFVINNQIGFTTTPKEGRSTFYCTDIAKTFNDPVFHVNAQDPEACVFASLLAIEIRQQFGWDVWIDLVCYRKYGHNESDEPAFTQPLEYQIIRKKKSVREIYRDELISQGILERYIAEQLEADFKQGLQNELEIKNMDFPVSTSVSLLYPSELKNWNLGSAKASRFDLSKPAQYYNIGLVSKVESRELSLEPKSNSSTHLGIKPSSKAEVCQTSVPVEALQWIGKALCRAPEAFHLHPKLEALNAERLQMIHSDLHVPSINWGMAEMLAFGSLLSDGIDVRLSGQDSARGTFSHRHAVWMDQKDGVSFVSLNHLKEKQGYLSIYNSPLSEFGVLGFEYGYSLGDPGSLVLWEAQFGDFCNGAQVVIDQYLASAEQKWGKHVSLVLLLPHGYEGQGPEHSSARIERFLSLCGDDNLRVMHPTTPAQFFHALRAQILLKTKKPLIVFTPKALLRHPSCLSCLQDFSTGHFAAVLDDAEQPINATTLVFCSGKIYYELVEERRKRAKEKEFALIRLEQLYPLDTLAFQDVLSRYPKRERWIWAQEEPQNMGAWIYVRPLLEEWLGGKIIYSGRAQSASPASGSYAAHKQEGEAILNNIFSQYLTY